jgi:hypothetical protein
LKPVKNLICLLKKANTIELRLSLETASRLDTQEFTKLYGTRRFITVFEKALNRSLSRIRPIQSTQPHSSSLRSTLILSSYLRLGLSSGFFPSGFSTKILYAFSFSTMRATFPAHLILFYFIILIILGEEYMLWSFSLWSFQFKN